jgi:hypothetical protein
VGRFTQEDTYRGDGLNLYSYVQNNPVKYIDPSGYSCESKNDVYAGVGKVKVSKSNVRDLLSGKDVEVNSIREADALLKEALPNARKATGAKPPKIDPVTGKEIYDVDYSQFKGTDPNGIYHKDYLMNSKGEVYGHPGENPHKLFKHINIKLPGGTKVAIKIKPNTPNALKK